ncbi:MAG: prepilin-type N-terminal cleavage/methylation domain-containing protein [Pirellulales bacterium]
MSRCRNLFCRRRLTGPRALSSSDVVPSSGLTLVEMLVAMAITLVMMAAVVNLFANVGASVRNRRATIEMGGQLRLVRLRLHNDLVGATCPTLTWQRPGDDNGYLEIVEGGWSDKNPSGLLDGDPNNGELDYATSLVPSGGDPLVLFPPTSTRPVVANDVTNGGGLGDYDDILALTVRSESEPFVGRRFNLSTNLIETIESTLAEIIWFAVENPADGSLGESGMRTIYRRVLLIAPWLENDLPLPGGATIEEDLLDFYRENDISVRIENGRLVPNTLGDLTKRENRFGHFGVPPNANVYPWAMDDRKIRHLISIDHLLEPLTGERQGEDVMLSDVLAFDVRVYDPGALVMQDLTTEIILEPSDLGWDPNVGNLASYGAYVDLGWFPNYPPAGLSNNAPEAAYPYQRKAGWHPNQPTAMTGYPAVYDTWSFHYENDGLNQDNLVGPDQGTNGLDDDNQNGVDDMGERETAPPYDVPLRGIQVKLRVYEPDTRNIRETTVTRNFVP